MTTLRERKKRATRTALSEAATQLVLEGGTEALTVSRIAERAKVSPRTFHNYFASTQDALIGFAIDTLEVLAGEIQVYPEELSATQVMEEIMLQGISERGFKLHSVMTLFRIGEVLDTLNHSPEYEEKFSGVLNAFVDGLHPRLPDLERWEVKIVLHAAASASIVAIREFNGRDDGDEIELRRQYIRSAFRVLRGIR